MSWSLCKHLYHTCPNLLQYLDEITYIEYILKYSNNLVPLDITDRVKVVQFKIFPGEFCHIPQKQLGIDPTPGYNSHLSPRKVEWYWFEESQCCPEYVSKLTQILYGLIFQKILEVEAYEDKQVQVVIDDL